MEWDSSLETGDPRIDGQHRALFELLDEVEAAEDTSGTLLMALDRLTEYVLVHFAMEEDLLQLSGYPEAGIEEHVSDHRRLVHETREQVLAFREGRLDDTDSIAQFLRDWLAIHVQRHDRELAEHVRSSGMEW